MPSESELLSRQERWAWEYFLKWYNDNGWTGEEARRLAWADLQRTYQRLQRFADPPVTTR